MRPFAVLDPNLDVSQSYFVEASAGTGKTFAIEHLVVRMLKELEPRPTIGRILVVTFTRAATRELRARIRLKLEQSGELREATAHFDEASIFTIHGFCYEMLRDYAFEAGLPLNLESHVSMQQRLGVIKDFFRTGLKPELFSAGQLGRALGLTRGDPDQLALRILKESGEAGPSFLDQFNRFCKAMRYAEPEAVMADFHAMKSRFTGLASRAGELKEGIEENVIFFARLMGQKEWTPGEFDRLIREGVVLLDLMARGKEKKRARRPEKLQVPWLFTWLNEEMGPLLDEAGDRLKIIRRMSHHCEGMLSQMLKEQEALDFDGLLSQMKECLGQPQFLEAVQGRFDAAIIDEFQDTDPLQWEIFRSLFAERKAFPFVLVGDPKQSIYRFRHADIYAYLDAAEVLGEKRRYSLGTNYRSRPGLLGELNRLFTTPELMALPKRSTYLAYHRVEAGIEEDNSLSVKDPVQFLEGDEAKFFAHTTNEILRIKETLGVSYNHFACLVADRYQAERFSRHAESVAIPVKPTRGRKASDSEALASLYEVYRAVLDPSDLPRVRLALGGRIFGWHATDLPRLFEALPTFYVLRERLLSKGFFSFFDHLMEINERRLLKEKGGGAFYTDLRQIAGMLTEHQLLTRATGDRLGEYFNDLKMSLETDDQMPRLLPENDEDGVAVMTTFGSKGLEFGVVFAAGLSGKRRVQTIEEEAEEMRLIYVALTRATDRVYVFVGLRDSPLAPLLEKVELKALGEVQARCAPTPSPPTLQRPEVITIPPSYKTMQSFTSLAKPCEGKKQVDPEALPAGKETGLVLHELLEHGPVTREQVHERLSGGELAPFEEEIFTICDAAWRIPLKGFSLSDVDPMKMRAEMEFLYGIESGCMTGVMDLFFEHREKYYLLDWKSNWLKSYDEASLKEEMENHDYYLQAKLYTEALSRYLKVVDERPFEECFGGTFYVFLRGGVALCL